MLVARPHRRREGARFVSSSEREWEATDVPSHLFKPPYRAASHMLLYCSLKSNPDIIGFTIRRDVSLIRQLNREVWVDTHLGFIERAVALVNPQPRQPIPAPS